MTLNPQGASQPAQAPIAATPVIAPEAPLPAIPEGGGRVIVDHQGDRTIITSAALPPQILPLANTAKETALGLMGLIAAIFILGPFARMIARRLERRPEVRAAEHREAILQQQIAQLQQSVDAMSVEVERISESQRFQSKLMLEKKELAPERLR